MGQILRVSMLGVAVAMAAGIGACVGGPKKYEGAQFADGAAIQKNSGSYWKRDGWWGGLPKTVQKVAITQFTIEYVTQNKNTSGADALSILGAMEMMGVGKRQRVFDENFKRQLPTVLYGKFVEALQAEGLEVVTMETLTSQPAFAQLKRGSEGAESSAFGRNLLGKVDRSESAKVQAYSAAGLPPVDDGWFNAGKNALAEGSLIGETGAQAGMRVRMRVALDDDGRAVLDAGSVIHLMYGLKQGDVAPGQKGWYVAERGNIISSQAMRDDVPVITSKEFQAFKGDVYTIDGPKFQESIMKMYPAYARMAASRMKSS
jgi:hypothetical protein